jgi:hypothetical protein
MVIFYLPHFYEDIITPKHGIYPKDALFNLLTPVNWSVAVFTIIYVSILQTVISVFRKPNLILIGLTTYFGVTLARMASMYFLTLEVPRDMILLIDPLSSSFYPERSFAKDLFFSGHVSTMTLLVLIEKNRLIRLAKIAATVVLGIFLIWQHVHYTVDILAAPLVTYGVFYIVRRLLEPNRKA